MNALLIISHGSRRAASNEEVIALTETIRTTSESPVSCGFLELVTPTVSMAIDQLVAEGATTIQIFPHFLAAGAHVTHDIPHEIEKSKQAHPSVLFHMLPHLGSLKELPHLILGLTETDS
jgi:sirohydrochlorin ferrochelatase